MLKVRDREINIDVTMLLKFVCQARHTINSWDISMYTSTLFYTKIFGLKKKKKIDRTHEVTITFTILKSCITYNKNDVKPYFDDPHWSPLGSPSSLTSLICNTT